MRTAMISRSKRSGVGADEDDGSRPLVEGFAVRPLPRLACEPVAYGSSRSGRGEVDAGDVS